MNNPFNPSPSGSGNMSNTGNSPSLDWGWSGVKEGAKTATGWIFKAGKWIFESGGVGIETGAEGETYKVGNITYRRTKDADGNVRTVVVSADETYDTTGKKYYPEQIAGIQTNYIVFAVIGLAIFYMITK